MTLWTVAHLSSVHGISRQEDCHAPSSRASFPPRDWTHVSYVYCIAGRFLYCLSHLKIETVKINLRFLWAAVVSASPFVNRCHRHLSGNSAHGVCVCVCARTRSCRKKWSLIPQWCLTTCILPFVHILFWGYFRISGYNLFHCKFKILVFYLQLWKHFMLIRTSGTGHSYQLHYIWISGFK